MRHSPPRSPNLGSDEGDVRAEEGLYHRERWREGVAPSSAAARRAHACIGSVEEGAVALILGGGEGIRRRRRG